MIKQSQRIILLLYVCAIYITLWNDITAAENNILKETGVYSIKTGDDYCFLMTFKMRLDLSYTKNDDTIGTQTFDNLTLTSSSTSQCTPEETTLILNGKPSNAQKDWTITFQFVKTDVSNTSEGNFQGSMIEVSFFKDPQVFPDTKVQEWITIQSNSTWGKSALGSYYHCVAPQSTNLEKDGKKGQIRLSDIKVQAFMLAKEPQFSEKENLCAADQTPDNTVPIAVGIALAVCIVIALVVFVIFNRRNRRNYGTV